MVAKHLIFAPVSMFSVLYTYVDIPISDTYSRFHLLYLLYKKISPEATLHCLS